MTRHVLLVEFARCREEGAAHCVDDIRKRQEEESPSRVVVIGLPRQKEQLDAVLNDFEWIPIEETEAPIQVAAAVKRLLEECSGTADSLSFMSFDGQLRNYVTAATTDTLTCHSFGFRFPRADSKKRYWPNSYPVGQREALRAAEEALRTRTPPRGFMYQTDLRPAMSMVNPDRFDGIGSFPGMIATIVKELSEKGIVRVEGNGVNPKLYPQAPPSSQGRHPSHTSALPGAPVEPEMNLSRRASISLGDRRRGPFSYLRDDLFDALEKVLEEGARPLTELANEAVEAAKAAMQEAGKLDRAKPWKRVIDFLITVLPAARCVLAEDGVPIGTGFANIGATVHRLSEYWRRDFEAELVRAAVEDPGFTDSRHDREEIAGCLFLDRSNAGVDRLDKLLCHLIDDGTVVESQSAFRLRDRTT